MALVKFKVMPAIQLRHNLDFCSRREGEKNDWAASPPAATALLGPASNFREEDTT